MKTLDSTDPILRLDSDLANQRGFTEQLGADCLVTHNRIVPGDHVPTSVRRHSLNYALNLSGVQFRTFPLRQEVSNDRFPMGRPAVAGSSVGHGTANPSSLAAATHSARRSPGDATSLTRDGDASSVTVHSGRNRRRKQS